MKKSLLKLFGVAAITWSAQLSAAGIGGINVISALGAPLKADIELVSVSNDEKSSLVARLASPEAYKAAGLDYPFTTKFKFTIETRADGSMFIRAASVQPVGDPFVSLLVELSWSTGRVSREYTFLLDPPGYQAEQPEVAPVQAVAPSAESVQRAVKPAAVVPDVAPAPVIAEPDSRPNVVPAEPDVGQAVPEKPANTHKSSRSSQPRPAKVQPSEAEEVSVQRGDSLNKIAAANRIDGVSLERMMVAFYRANVEQFEGHNINRIKAGKVLRKPSAAELAALTQADATSEIHAQVDDWNAYRQKIASLVTASASPDAQQHIPRHVSSGKVTSSVADKAPVAKETAKEVLKLSKGDAPSDKAGSGKSAKQDKQDKIDKKNAAQEETIAKAKAAEEERTRTAMLEKNLQDIKHLAELKTQAAALAQAASAPKTPVAAQANAASAVVAASSVGASSAVAAASAVNPASAVVPASAVASAVKPVPKPVVKPQPVVVEDSLLDQLMSDPKYLGGALAALFGMGGLGLAVLRRRKTVQVKPPEVDMSGKDTLGTITSHISAPVMPSPDTGDFTTQSTVTQSIPTRIVEEDPISEAELFLSFGRDAQAEEILQEALHSVADKMPIQMKLLEIYAARKDTVAFAATAGQMKGASDSATWKKIEAMGLKVDPHNPLYGGEAQVEISQSSTMQTQTVVLDTPLSLDAPLNLDKKVVAPPPVETSPSMLEFDDLASAFFTGTPTQAKTPVMDLDVTADHSRTSAQYHEATMPNFEDLVFDVTATHPPFPAATAAAAGQHSASDDLPFLMDFPLDVGDATISVTPAKPSEFKFSDINLNLSTDQPDTGAKAGTDHWHEVSTKLDLARVYHEMGDAAGAKDILAEVLQEGDAAQRAAAQDILKQLS